MSNLQLNFRNRLLSQETHLGHPWRSQVWMWILWQKVKEAKNFGRSSSSAYWGQSIFLWHLWKRRLKLLLQIQRRSLEAQKRQSQLHPECLWKAENGARTWCNRVCPKALEKSPLSTKSPKYKSLFIQNLMWSEKLITFCCTFLTDWRMSEAGEDHAMEGGDPSQSRDHIAPHLSLTHPHQVIN